MASEAQSAALEALDACSLLTVDMIRAARSGCWEAVAEMDRRRRSQLGALPVGALSATEAELLMPVLRRLADQDGELLRLAEAERDERLQAVRGIRRSGAARSSYEQSAADCAP